MDRYAVIGNPIAHSKSPLIHAAFAAQTGEVLSYEALLAPVDAFRTTVERFRASGGRGLNVTLPFKLEAFDYAQQRSARAQAAGAVNTLLLDGEVVRGDNTDGAGLVRDVRDNLGIALAGRRILLLGAGGAARGAIAPLLAERPASVAIANRSPAKADALCAAFAGAPGDGASDAPRLSASSFAALAGQTFDIVINATSASLDNDVPALPGAVYADCLLAYDMMYGAADTAFIATARAAGANRCADGLGMLVEQAAESFFLWRGRRPDTAPVLARMRQLLAGG